MNVKFQVQRESMTSDILISLLDYFGLIDYFLRVQQQMTLISMPCHNNGSDWCVCVKSNNFCMEKKNNPVLLFQNDLYHYYIYGYMDSLVG